LGSQFSRQVPQGSTFPADQNKWYGKLELAVGTYEIEVHTTWTDAGTQKTTKILSMIGDIAPIRIDYWPWLIIGVLAVGVMLVVSTAFIAKMRRVK